MIDIAPTVSQPFQWGPYIAIGITALFGAFAFAVKRILNRIDELGTAVQTLTTDMALVKLRQTLTAQRVGVTPKELEDTQP
jgi:hypothetical protein